MKFIRSFFILLFITCTFNVFAEDTTWVQVHDHTDMTWYGHYKKWGEFPNEDKEFRKVLLHYTMGCASTGCSGWDYTTHINLRHRTGVFDSTLVLAPSFTLDGATLDSINVSTVPTYTIVFDSINGLDTIYNDTLVLIEFNDLSDPWAATDTSIVFDANFFLYYFDSEGAIIDSNWVGGDLSIQLSTTDTYNVYEVIDEYELGRAITPYGTYMNPANGGYGTNGYDLNWEHTFVFDITDYQHLLVDSVEIDAFYSGWTSGFSATLDFEFIEGTPPREVIRLRNVYKNGASSYSYSSSNDFETNQMPLVQVDILENAEEVKLKFVPSGHGESGEFTPGVYYDLLVNNQSAGSNQMWKDDCGFNAIWPQGGTWIFDRANWCPGEAVPQFNHEITSFIDFGVSNSFDINFTNYNPSNGASYSCAIQLFEYKKSPFMFDVEMVDIITPSNHDMHSRINPSCGKPIIEIRNGGTETLTSAIIKYKMKGGTEHEYEWNGNLDYRKTTRVSLPTPSWDGVANIFEVEVTAPNGESDQETLNNTMVSNFELTPVYDNEFRVYLKTNNYGSESLWTITNTENEVVASRTNCSNDTYHIDTVSLGNGCHTFTLEDTGGDGLDFWWSNAQTGTGQIKFQNLANPGFIKTFEPDFGSKIIHNFMIGYPMNIEEESTRIFNIYPNPTTGQIQVELTENNQPFNIQLCNILGEAVWNENIKVHTSQKTFDISDQPNGVYLLKMQVGDKKITEKIILNR